MTLALYVLFGLVLATTIRCDVPFNTTTLSAPKIAVSSLEVNDNVYFVGGYAHHDLVASDRVDVFNLVNQTWSESLTLPKARAHITPLHVDPYIYFVGGAYYENVPYYFSPDVHDFVAVNNTPPTVFQPIRMALYNGIVTLIGSHSVDFMNVSSGEWHTFDTLTRVTRSVHGAFIFSVEGLVYVLGGMNITSKENLTVGWIFNTSSEEIIETTLPNNFTTSLPYNFQRLNGATSIWIKNQVYINSFGGEWHDFMFLDSYNSITSIQSANQTTFVFGGFNYYAYDHINRTGTLVPSESIICAWTVDNLVTFLMPDSTGGTSVHIFKNGIWNIITAAITLTHGNVFDTIRWGDHRLICSSTAVTLWRTDLKSFSNVYHGEGILAVFLSSTAAEIYIFSRVQNITVTYGHTSNFFLTSTKYPLSLGIPDTIVGGTMIGMTGRIYTVSNSSYSYTQSRTFAPASKASAVIWRQDKDQFFAIVNPAPSDLPQYRHLYNFIDVYNYRNKTWEDSIPMIEDITEPASQFLPAAAVGNNILIWSDRQLAILDLSNNNTWNRPVLLNGSNVVISQDDIYHVFNPVTMVNQTAYLTIPGDVRLYKFSPDSLAGWESTNEIPSQVNVRQVLLYNDQILFVSVTPSNNDTFEVMYFYDIQTSTWQITYPPTIQRQVTIALVGSFLLSMGDSTSLNYYHIPSGTWYSQEISLSGVPATVISTSRKLTLIAGGQEENYPLYVDTVLLFNDDEITLPPMAPISQGNLAPASNPIEDNTTVIVAIVVPIGAVTIAGAIILIVLLHRQRKKKRSDKGSMSTIGLETTYGQWFIPYNEVMFGKQLGQGGTGQVFEGTWKGTTVALKVSMTQANATVIGELQLMMQLRPHPHVVQLFGFSVHPETDSIILVIEYCNGGSLDDVLFARTDQLSKKQKLLWILDIAKGLSHLHSNNIVHRDVAARNVLLNQNEPKITDFGRSRLVEEDNQRGTTKSELGPIRWMSPESLKNKEYSTKSDIWSFGILMFEIAAQKEPHSEADPIEIGRLIRDKGLTPDTSSCPLELASVMKDCWQVTPEQRPSIDALISRLEKLQIN